MKKFTANKSVFDYGYLFIVLSVLTFSLTAVFYPNILYHDDGAYYYRVANYGLQIPTLYLKHLLLSPYRLAIEIQLLYISPQLARMFVTVIYMIPVSLFFYYTMKNIFKMDKSIAFLAAVIPNIIPFQTAIPVGINGGYVVPGFLTMLVSLVAGFKYLISEKNDKNLLIVSLILFFIGLNSSSQAVLIAPLPIAVFILIKSDKTRKLLILTFTSSLFILYFLLNAFTRRNAGADNNIDKLTTGFSEKLFQILPNEIMSAEIIFAVFILIIFLALLIYRMNYPVKTYKGFFIFKNDRKTTIFIIITFLISAIITILPLLLIRKEFVDRYIYQSCFMFLMVRILLVALDFGQHDNVVNDSAQKSIQRIRASLKEK